MNEKFVLDEECYQAILNNAALIESEPPERANSELTKIICSKDPTDGLSLMKELRLMKYLIPELDELARVNQPAEYYRDDVLTHSLKVMENVDGRRRLRLAALFHDLGKAYTRKMKDGAIVFHGHQTVGAEKAREILTRLRYPGKMINDVCRLIELHMVAYRREWSDTTLRRFVHEAGALLDDLLLLYRSDIQARKHPHNDLGMFTHLIERIKIQDIENLINIKTPLSGDEIMDLLGLVEGPKVGEVQHALEQAIIDGKIANDPSAATNYVLSEFS